MDRNNKYSLRCAEQLSGSEKNVVPCDFALSTNLSHLLMSCVQVAPPVWQDNAPTTGSQLTFQYSDANFCINNGWCAYTHDVNCPANKGARTFQITSSGQLQALAVDGTVIWMTPTPVPGTTQNRYATFCCLASAHVNYQCTLAGYGQ